MRENIRGSESGGEKATYGHRHRCRARESVW